MVSFQRLLWILTAVVIIVLLVVSLLFIIGININSNIDVTTSDNLKSLPNVCTTFTCNQSAFEIVKNMDDSVDPCQDFYAFACGNFLKNTNIPDEKIYINAGSSTEEKVQEQLKNCLEEPISPDELESFKVPKTFYKSCINTTAIELQGLEPIKKILKELGGWPVIEGRKWNSTTFHWTELVYKFRKIGYSVSYFLDLNIVSDPLNSTKQILQLDQVSFKPEHGFLLQKFNDEVDTESVENDVSVEAYHSYMFDLAVILGAPTSNITKTQLWQILQFERALINISLPNEEHDVNLLHNPMTVANLSTKYSSIPWKKYFNKILEPLVTVDDDEVINVAVPSYIWKFEKLINTTSRRIQANYAIWRAIEESVPFLTREIVMRQSQFLMVSSGTTQQEPRWKECIQGATIFPSVHAMYIRKYFDANAKNNVVQMVDNIKNQLNKTLQMVDWMDNETRNHAMDKAAAMSAYIAYPDELFDDDTLKEVLHTIKLVDDKYMENILKLKLFVMEDEFSHFRQPINKSDWINHMGVAVVNAFYNSHENSIELPAGILQGIFFNNNRPKYMNYGTIGSIIGHEITHGFDNGGRLFDQYGNLKNWWTPSTDKLYRRKADCIANQYNKYTVTEIDEQVNGYYTLDENIADNGGLKLAYLAYDDWSRRNEEEPTLPGLQFNPRQLFWISIANMWCSKERKEISKYSIHNDNHSPDKFRVIGSFSNMDAFARDFNCPIGSEMHPKKKCSLW